MTARAVTIGLIDGPLDEDMPELIARHDFTEAHDGSPAARHARALAATMLFHAPAARFVNGVVFSGALATGQAVIAAALDRFLAEPVDILHCSFGFAQAEPTLAELFAEAAGRMAVVASAAARGALTVPARLNGIIAVQGDARCAPDQWSHLAIERAEFGAHANALGDPTVRGASAAAAHFSGLLAARMTTGLSRDAALDDLRSKAHWFGPERRLN